jgi:hypothetical protein
VCAYFRVTPVVSCPRVTCLARPSRKGYSRIRTHLALQGYLAHKKHPPPLGPPQGPRRSPTVGSCGGAVSYEQGIPAGSYGRNMPENMPWHSGESSQHRVSCSLFAQTRHARCRSCWEQSTGIPLSLKNATPPMASTGPYAKAYCRDLGGGGLLRARYPCIAFQAPLPFVITSRHSWTPFPSSPDQPRTSCDSVHSSIK